MLSISQKKVGLVAILDIFRGAAALWVFIYHIARHFQNIPLFFTFASYDSFGVPMSFVISGFVITASAESILHKKYSPKNLYIKNSNLPTILVRNPGTSANSITNLFYCQTMSFLKKNIK
jgi:hypothetical protein